MDLAGKLQLKPGQSVSIVNEPADIVLDLGGGHPAAGDPSEADAVIVFATDRDVLADLVKREDVRPVRQVALDDVWSALRLRPA